MINLNIGLFSRPFPILCFMIAIVLGISCNPDDEAMPRTVIVASFEAKVSASNTLTYNFINNSLVDGSNTGAFTSSWDFGGDGTSTEKNPSHIFSAPGNYEITLTITSTDGEVDVETKTIIVEDDMSTPIAAFISNKELAPELTYSFTNTSIVSGILDNSFTSSWDFGGDGTSTEESPIHTFSSEGIYEVSLTITAADGEVDVETNTIIVERSESTPVAGFIANPDLNIDLTFSFTNTSVVTGISDPSFTSSWDFGGDGTSTEKEPTHTFSAEGFYDVTLTVTAADGKVDAITQTIDVRIIANKFARITDSHDDNIGELRLTVNPIKTGRLNFRYRVAAGPEMDISDAFIMISGDHVTGDMAITEIRFKDDSPHLFREGASDETIDAANFPEGMPDVWVPVEISWRANGSNAPLYTVIIGGQLVIADAISTTNGGPDDVADHLAAVLGGAQVFMWRYNANAFTSDGVYEVDDIKIYSSDSGTETMVFEDNFEAWQIGEDLSPEFNPNSPYTEKTIDATVAAE